MSELDKLDNFIKTQTQAMEIMLAEIKGFKEHAVEVLADQLWDDKNTLEEARAEARELLGIKEGEK